MSVSSYKSLCYLYTFGPLLMYIGVYIIMLQDEWIEAFKTLQSRIFLAFSTPVVVTLFLLPFSLLPRFFWLCEREHSDRWRVPLPPGRQSLWMRAHVNHPLSCDGSCQWRASHMAWHHSWYVTHPVSGYDATLSPRVWCRDSSTHREKPTVATTGVSVEGCGLDTRRWCKQTLSPITELQEGGRLNITYCL